MDIDDLLDGCCPADSVDACSPFDLLRLELYRLYQKKAGSPPFPLGSVDHQTYLREQSRFVCEGLALYEPTLHIMVDKGLLRPSYVRKSIISIVEDFDHKNKSSAVGHFLYGLISAVSPGELLRLRQRARIQGSLESTVRQPLLHGSPSNPPDDPPQKKSG